MKKTEDSKLSFPFRMQGREDVSGSPRRMFWRIFIAAGLILFILSEGHVHNDFDIFLSASHDLTAGKNIYSILYHQWYHYYYSPFFAFLLTPFTWLSPYMAKILWLGLNVFFLFRICKIAGDVLGLTQLSFRTRTLVLFLSLLFVSRFLRDNFHVGQMTISLLWLSLESLVLIHKKKWLKGACLLALGINIKLLPLVLLPWLLYRGYFRAFAGTVVFSSVFLALPAFFIGYSYNQMLLSSWWNLINPANTEHLVDVSERSFHSLSALLPVLLMENISGPYVLTQKRNIANLSAAQVVQVLLYARLALVAFTLYFVRMPSFRENISPLRLWRETSYLFLVAPLLFPHQQPYAFFFAFPAAAYLMYFFVTNKSFSGTSTRIALLTITGLVFLAFNLSLFLGEYREYYEYFKIVTYGALLLIIPLALCRAE